MITNTTYRVLVEKLGDSNPSQFIGNEGEIFYDPSSPQIYLSDGSSQGGIVIGGGGGGGNTGDVTFNLNKVIGSGTGSGDGNGYSTLELVPDNSLYGGNQYIIVDPTGPNHIHLRAGGTQDNSNSELYLGGEKNNVRIIDNTGVRLLNEDTTQNILELQNGDLNVVVRDDVRIIGGDVVSLRNTSLDEPITIITNYDNNDYTWAFNENGTLTFPNGNIQTTGITDTKISEWDDAYGWGDHSVVGYQTATTASYAQTLIVDPNGDDVTGNGGPNAPFQTLQRAHDYTIDNPSILPSDQVVVRLNTGSYGGNLLVTRPNIHFVGPTQGVSKSTRISGIVTVSTASSVGGVASDMVSFENILIAGSGDSVVTIGGTFGCSVMFKDAYVFTDSSTSKCVDVTNTAASGVGIHMKNTQLQNLLSSGVTLNLSNTYYANLDLVTLFSGTGISMNITTTNAVVYNTRIEKTGIGTAIVANSPFTAGKPSLILGSATIVNPTANSDGILVPSGSIINIAQVAFNIAGTGFAVKGSAGSVVVHGNNLFVPGTTNKISSGIGAGNIPLTTAFTAA